MKKISSYAFWVALSGAVAVFLEDISNILGLSINVSVVESLILSFCGVLVVLGIVNKKEENSQNSTIDTQQIDKSEDEKELSDLPSDMDIIEKIEDLDTEPK